MWKERKSELTKAYNVNEVRAALIYAADQLSETCLKSYISSIKTLDQLQLARQDGQSLEELSEQISQKVCISPNHDSLKPHFSIALHKLIKDGLTSQTTAEQKLNARKYRHLLNPNVKPEADWLEVR